MTKALPIGTRLHSNKEKYEIVSVIGNGNFGITYKAKMEIMHGHIPIYGDVAIKEFFMPSICVRENDGTVSINALQKNTFYQCRDDFKKEAEALQQLTDSDGVVKVNETFEANGTCYYVMEYLGDTSLKIYVQERGQLSEEEALTLFAKLASAVGSLHSQNRLHLDIKPGNVMMTDRGPKLIDFGQSRQFGKSGHPKYGGKGACSDGYAPQEQYDGVHSFLPGIDIYALGAVLLFMLTGKRPPAAQEMERQEIESLLPKDVSDITINVISRCMAYEAKDRYSCVGEILRELPQGIVSMNDEEEDDGTVLINDMPSSYRFGKRKLVVLLAATVVFTAMCGIKLCNTRKETKQGVVEVKDTTRCDTIKKEKMNVSKESVPLPIPQTEKPVKQSPKQTSPKENKPSTSPTYQRQETTSLGWAEWYGSVDEYGQPTGIGTLRVKRTKTLGDGVTVNPGDRIEDCEFYQNRVYQGILYRKGETSGEYINI